MLRGNLGVLPRTSRLADESYLDFAESFRNIAGYGMFPVVAEVGDAKVKEELGSLDPNLDLEEVKKVFHSTAITPVWQRFMRTDQEMMWRRARQSFLPFADELEARMKAAESKGPGKLTYSHNFVPPEYTREEIHLQPGGYTEDNIGGIVYHYGTKVFYGGMNDQDEMHDELARTMTPPADGKVERILDIGCSIGQATMKLRDYYPDAEIIGLDVGLPLVRYAHMCAVERGINVDFMQGLAEDTGFDDGHFDTVFSYILFHEVAVDKISEIIEEAYRILRPGGTFCIWEFPSASQNLPPSQRFLIDYDSRNNCEPYSPGFVYADFHAILKDAGFTVAPGPKNSNHFLQTLVCTKPA